MDSNQRFLSPYCLLKSTTSPECRSLLRSGDLSENIPAEYLENSDFWRERVHPDDLARVETEIGRLFGNDVHSLEYRFRRKDGSYCWVNDEQRLPKDKIGKPLEIVGSWSDVAKPVKTPLIGPPRQQ